MNKRGSCSLCGKESTYIYDTMEPDKNLVQLFEGLLDIYKPFSDVDEITLSNDQSDFLRNDLFDRWNLFNIDKDKIIPLLKSLCAQKYLDEPEIFTHPVVITSLHNDDYIQNNSILKNYRWGNFLEAIKHENRFHTNYFNLEMFDLFLEFSQKTFHKGERFYRARISNEDGFILKEMGAPPKELASEGRVNAAGISCLYVSQNRETTIREIRAGAHDFVTIAEFKLKKDINVVDLVNLPLLSPFKTIDYIDYTQHALNRRHLEKIGEEIAKPLRRQDSPLDYLPTQYISDFIRSRGYQGIQYTSTMHEGESNLAIFDEKLMDPIGVSVVKINAVNYNHVPYLVY
nr:RES family NAD+ phosphorylase [Paenibacillus xylanexedens]